MDDYYQTTWQNFIILWHQNQLRIYLQQRTNFAKNELMPGHISVLIKELEGYYSCHRRLECSTRRYQSDQGTNLSTAPATKEGDALQVIWISTSYSTETIVKPVKVRTWSSLRRHDWPDQKTRGWTRLSQLGTMIYRQTIIISAAVLQNTSQQAQKKRQIQPLSTTVPDKCFSSKTAFQELSLGQNELLNVPDIARLC